MVQSRWVMTGKACGSIVENSPRQLWKKRVSTAHNGISDAPAAVDRRWIFHRSNAGPRKKGTGRLAHPVPKRPEMGGYFSELLIDSKFELSLVPRPFTAVMIAIEIPAAIRPYSMAVAPDSSLKNDLMIDIGWFRPVFVFLEPRLPLRFLSGNLRK